jgi:hypothetical protein
VVLIVGVGAGVEAEVTRLFEITTSRLEAVGVVLVGMDAGLDVLHCATWLDAQEARNEHTLWVPVGREDWRHLYRRTETARAEETHGRLRGPGPCRTST